MKIESKKKFNLYYKFFFRCNIILLITHIILAKTKIYLI